MQPSRKQPLLGTKARRLGVEFLEERPLLSPLSGLPVLSSVTSPLVALTAPATTTANDSAARSSLLGSAMGTLGAVTRPVTDAVSAVVSGAGSLVSGLTTDVGAVASGAGSLVGALTSPVSPAVADLSTGLTSTLTGVLATTDQVVSQVTPPLTAPVVDIITPVMPPLTAPVVDILTPVQLPTGSLPPLTPAAGETPPVAAPVDNAPPTSAPADGGTVTVEIGTPAAPVTAIPISAGGPADTAGAPPAITPSFVTAEPRTDAPAVPNITLPGVSATPPARPAAAVLVAAEAPRGAADAVNGAAATPAVIIHGADAAGITVAAVAVAEPAGVLPTAPVFPAENPATIDPTAFEDPVLQPSGLLEGLAAEGLEGLERAAEDVFGRLGELTGGSLGLAPWLSAMAVAALAYEVARRDVKRQRSGRLVLACGLGLTGLLPLDDA